MLLTFVALLAVADPVPATNAPALAADVSVQAVYVDEGVLLDALNTLLCAGQLSAAAKSIIVNYVADTTRFPYTSPTPTNTQMRDRVRAVVHLIVSSPEFIVQK